MSLKIGVLMGGVSDEKLVSISTGNEVLKALVKLGYLTKKILINENYKKYINEFKDCDLIFNALHGGEGEDGKIQQWMDNNNIKYTGSGPKSSELCMNKARSKEFAELMSIRTPKWQLIKNIKERIKPQFPVVIKPNTQGSTFGLTIVKNELQLPVAIKEAFKFGDEIIVEEYIRGREVTIPILGDEVYPIIEIVPSNELYDFQCKYTPGMTEYICPAKLENKLILLINKQTELLFGEFGCNVYARVDYIIGEDGHPYFLEVNTLPGLTKTSLMPKSLGSNGINFESLIAKIVDLSI